MHVYKCFFLLLSPQIFVYIRDTMNAFTKVLVAAIFLIIHSPTLAQGMCIWKYNNHFYWLSLFLFNIADGVIHYFPVSFVSFPGGSAQFTCQALPLNQMISFRWYLNGTQFDNLNLTKFNVKSQFEFGIGSLRFTDIPIEFNGTRVQCEIMQTSSQSLISGIVSLSLQGYSYFCMILIGN